MYLIETIIIRLRYFSLRCFFSAHPAGALNAYCARLWSTGEKQACRPRQKKKSTITVRADPCQRSSASSPPTGGSNTLNPCPASPATPSASAGQPAAAAVLPSSTHTRVRRSMAATAQSSQPSPQAHEQTNWTDRCRLQEPHSS